MAFELPLVLFSVLTSSFLGSWHCAGMCGSFCSLFAARGTLGIYQLGRGLGYVTLGALAGAFGEKLLKIDIGPWRWAFAGLLALGILLVGLQFIGLDLKFPLGRIHTSKFLRGRKNPFILGLLSFLLPCGWLYLNLMGAAATKSPWAGTLFMFFFWLGTLPALMGLGLYFKKSVGNLSLKNRRIAGVILMVASFYSLFSYYLIK